MVDYSADASPELAQRIAGLSGAIRTLEGFRDGWVD